MPGEAFREWRRKRRWSVVSLVLMALGFALSVWGLWDAWYQDDRWRVFRRYVGAFLFLFWFLQRYGAYRSLRREG